MTTLIGFSVLPADTFAEGPQSGADNGNGDPISANGRTGPFDGQPVQGFSGVQFAPSENGAFWVLSDNGFGAQSNSADYLLRLYQIDPNFSGTEGGDGTIEFQGFVQLSDPDNLIPFSITNEGTEERFLTGADFDIESFAIDNKGDIWIGDEFGPYLLHFNSEGELLEAPIATPNITNFNTLNGQTPLVIGHRGASGTLPEHTLEAYELAIEQGADFIEPDLVVTKDGVLIARHEPTLAQVELDEEGNIKFDENGKPILKAGTANTTNVFELPEFSDRLTVKSLDGKLVGGWYAEDFTLEEIKQLTAIQSRDYRDQSFNDDGFKVPTFAEVIALAKEKGVGIYPETKHPTYFGKEGTYLDGTPINVDTSQLLIDTFVANNFTEPDRIFIQSFEIENLLRLQNEIMPAAGIDIPLVQLTDDVKTSVYDVAFNFRPGNPLANPEIYEGIPVGLRENTDYGDLLNTAFIDWIADNYAEGLGSWKETFRLTEKLAEPVDGNGDGVAEITKTITGQVVPIVDWAHDARLQVHTYTMRDEERHLYLVDGKPESAQEEYRQLIELGVDGFFTDFPGTGAAVINSLVNSLAEDFVQSPQNPDLGDALPNLSQSRGFEGMAFSPDRTTLYPLLEGVVDGDPENALRIYEFDVASSSFTGLVGYYPTTNGNPIGDFTPINDSEFLVIERDGGQGETAEFKKIFKINIDNIDANGFVEKTELVDLLNIADPNDLNDDGNTTYSMPFVTIEDVVVIDPNTILVANDNNYPFSVGRSADIDNNEVVLISLEEPLNLHPSLGGTAITPTLIQLTQPAQMTGLNGYNVDPIFTVGEQINNYAPPGILDGLGAFAFDDDTVRVLANHELRSSQGYAYTLANGTELTGARVSFFDINKETLELEDAGLAYDTIINRAGEVVDEASDLEFEGINRLCSAQYIEAHQFGAGRGLEDAMFFTGEETSGGTEFVIDPETNTMYAVPWMGRAAWESVTELDTGTTNKVALLVGDDREAAPLLMYVGEKDDSNPDDFLARNGLKGGKLYAWVPDGEVADTPTFLEEENGNLVAVDQDTAPDPFGFNGTGNSLGGSWVELDYYRPDLAGTAFDIDGDGSIQDELGYDELGFATQALQDRLFIDVGGFQFSRPEDLATNPEDGTVAVMASTGRSGRFPEDSWGTTYTVDTEFDAEGNPLTAQIDILYDGDDAGAGQFANPDDGLRSPDNLEWADDGQIYLQEDRSFSEFGLTSGQEASIWRLDPGTGILTRVAQMDRSAVPEGQTDGDPTDIGDWESSGIIDVSSLFGDTPGTRFIFDVQAHSLRDGIIEDADLVQGGQIAFLTTPTESQEILGTPGNDSLTSTEEDELLRGLAGDDTIFAAGGDDRVVGSFGNDSLVGGSGNDRVTGDEGDDTLIGVDITSFDSTFGQGERDILVGNRQSDSTGSDTFILGNENSVFYNDGDSSSRGQGDLARILGFNPADDTIQLSGSSDLYSLEFSSVGETTNATLIYNPESQLVGEVIARIVDVSSELSLDDSAFTFV